MTNDKESESPRFKPAPTSNPWVFWPVWTPFAILFTAIVVAMVPFRLIDEYSVKLGHWLQRKIYKLSLRRR